MTLLAALPADMERNDVLIVHSIGHHLCHEALQDSLVCL
mgnify:CR=1 FL=1